MANVLNIQIINYIFLNIQISETPLIKKNLDSVYWESQNLRFYIILKFNYKIINGLKFRHNVPPSVQISLHRQCLLQLLLYEISENANGSLPFKKAKVVARFTCSLGVLRANTGLDGRWCPSHRMPPIYSSSFLLILYLAVFQRSPLIRMQLSNCWRSMRKVRDVRET